MDIDKEYERLTAECEWHPGQSPWPRCYECEADREAMEEAREDDRRHGL